ncbi:MAG: transcriptional regulator [Acidobacteriota bacterium]|nr:transcriptional regulator [Acidobacteriota bacterium]
MQVKPIRNKKDYRAALQRIEDLWGAARGTEDGDLLDVLAMLVEAYEREHFPMDCPDPIEAIKFRLDQMGKDYRDLVGIIGQRTRVYEVMRRDRPLSLSMIRNLNTELQIPAGVLIQPFCLRQKKASAALDSHEKKRA